MPSSLASGPAYETNELRLTRVLLDAGQYAGLRQRARRWSLPDDLVLATAIAGYTQLWDNAESGVTVRSADKIRRLSVATDAALLPNARVARVRWNSARDDSLAPDMPAMQITRDGGPVWRLPQGLNLQIYLDEAVVRVRAAWDPGEPERTTVASFLDGLATYANECLAEPDRPLESVRRVSPSAAADLLALGRGEPSSVVAFEPVVSTIVAHAGTSPDQLAVVCAEESLTYRELIARARGVTAALGDLGVRRGDVVVIAYPRSVDATVAVLGVLMAGATYVPVDTEAPERRITSVLHQLSPAACLRPAGQPLPLDGVPMLSLDEVGAVRDDLPHRVEVRPEDLAYILFTSGTTGTPKGVQISNLSLTHMCVELSRAYRIRPADRVLAFAPLHFDVSVFELFATLASGATLCLATADERQDPALLSDMMRARRVTVADLPPALLPLLEPDNLPDLRLLSVGGEPFSGRLVETWATGEREFWNSYGPTETTVVVTLHRCVGRYERTVPIGRPMPGYRAFVIDRSAGLVPRGAAGELCIAGPCVADGYLGNPGLTGQVFVPAVDGEGTMYRTGDLVRWRPDGTLDFLGRADRQVKVAGHRIELGDIEAAMLLHPSVTAAVAQIVTGAAGPVVAGFFVGTAEVAALRSFLRRALPRYALPNRLLPVPAFPTTSTGKVDHRALAALAEQGAGGAARLSLPRRHRPPPA